MLIIPVLIILFLDQLTKSIVIKNLSPNQSIPIIKGLLYVTFVRNRGAAFGILKNQLPLFIFTALFAVVLIFLVISKKRQRPLILNISLGLILAGAIGNLIDRIFLGYVVDFIDFRIWPVFNVADSAITIGAVLLGWSILKHAS
ncbi:MAG: signal peptidase II [Omnitrophica WOR_2 bacterium RBG_13_41_10]|nr:MAG: signal peptidase II [Omnitrophica WOR_2 bacterium RBG_13_41_10]